MALATEIVAGRGPYGGRWPVFARTSDRPLPGRPRKQTYFNSKARPRGRAGWHDDCHLIAEINCVCGSEGVIYERREGLV